MTQNMETDPFNVSMRKFLKQVGVTRKELSRKPWKNADWRAVGV